MYLYCIIIFSNIIKEIEKTKEKFYIKKQLIVA